MQAATIATGEARAAVVAGIEDRVAPLRVFSLRHRAVELVVFPTLWLLGASLTLGVPECLEAGWLQWILVAVGILLAAVGLNAFVLLLHEGMHHTLFANRRLNRWVSVLLGLPLLMSFSAYQVLHLRHHTFLGDARDPDDYANYSKRPWLVWWMHIGRLAFGAFLYLLFIPILALRHAENGQRRRILEEYAVLTVASALVVWRVPGDVILWGWFFPVVIVGYMTNIRGFTQHGITDAHDPYLASRTMKPHPFVAFCLLNENYHLEHHLFPEVPSHHLHALHELIWPRLPRVVTGRSYLAFLATFVSASLRRDDLPIGLTMRQESLTSGASTSGLWRTSCRARTPSSR
jgi:fatty acid desaturase